MSVKNRLLELQQKSGNGVLDSNGEGKEKNEAETMFVVVEDLNRLINKVEENTRTCEEILWGRCRLGTPKEQQMRLVATFKDSELICFKISKELKAMNASLKNDKRNDAEHRMKYLQYVSLGERFKNSITNHQDCVQKHKDINSEFLERSWTIVKGSSVSAEECEELLEQSRTQMFVGDYLMEESAVRRQLADIETRHNQLLAIESHLVEIRDLFIEMAVLIEQQQESINRIEYHASSATDYVENTVIDLHRATDLKRKSTKKCIYLWIAVGVIITIVILALIY